VSTEKRGNGPGMPAFLYLEQFGSCVWEAFGHAPFLVGSCVTSKEWRDVDVRLMLPDEEYDALIGPSPGGLERANGKWAALCMAFSALGRQMTGLPIDFQIQKASRANERYPGPREALGMVSWRFLEPPDAKEPA
jgi:hypothetical protein